MSLEQNFHKISVYFQLRHFAPRSDIRSKDYEPHVCGPNCLPEPRGNLKTYSPLSKPLLSCWERQIVKQKAIKSIMYKTPCGRRLRNMNEVFTYLKLTDCPLNVENFTFDVAVQVLVSYDVDKSLCGLHIDVSSSNWRNCF